MYNPIVFNNICYISVLFVIVHLKTQVGRQMTTFGPDTGYRTVQTIPVTDSLSGGT